MRNRSVALCGLAVLAVAIVSACSDYPPTEPRAAEPESPLFQQSAQAQAPQEFDLTLDGAFVRIARDVPGFGGLYYDDDGVLTVVMAPSAGVVRAPEVASALAGHLSELRIDRSAARAMRVVEGEYDFIELDAMHRTARNVLGLRGTVFTDADEVRNRIVIGVEDDAAEAAVTRALTMAGLPGEAVIIERSAPIVTEQSLQERVRPVAGGLQINFTRGATGFLCTHGFNVRSPAAPNLHGFVTNSHCSDTRSLVLDTPYWQHSRFVENTFIGNEVWDIPPTTGGNCPAGRVCRWSDALGAVYEAGVDNEFGSIYRTLFPGTGLEGGSLIIDPDNPRWEIVDEIPFPVLGQTVHKTGRTNGWTMGPVNQTCQTVNVGGTNFTMFCQDRVTTWSAGGDSGSPYFERIGETNQIRLVGIHWGSDGAGNTVMSAMNNIRCENEGPAPYITFPGQPPPATPLCAR